MTKGGCDRYASRDRIESRQGTRAGRTTRTKHPYDPPKKVLRPQYKVHSPGTADGLGISLGVLGVEGQAGGLGRGAGTDAPLEAPQEELAHTLALGCVVEIVGIGGDGVGRGERGRGRGCIMLSGVVLRLGQGGRSIMGLGSKRRRDPTCKQAEQQGLLGGDLCCVHGCSHSPLAPATNSRAISATAVKWMRAMMVRRVCGRVCGLECWRLEGDAARLE